MKIKLGFLIGILAVQAWGQTSSSPAAVTTPAPLIPLGQAGMAAPQDKSSQTPVPHLALSLSDLIEAAFKNSAKLQSANFSYESARSEAGSMGAAEFPKLGLSGNYFYQTYVPEFSIFPKTPEVAFGEANNWSA